MDPLTQAHSDLKAAETQLIYLTARLSKADTLSAAAKEVLRWYDAMPGTGHAEEMLRMAVNAYESVDAQA